MTIKFAFRPEGHTVIRTGFYRPGATFPNAPLRVGEDVTLTLATKRRQQVHAVIHAIDGDQVAVETTRRLAGKTYKDTLVAAGQKLRVHERQITGAGLATVDDGPSS